MDNSSAAILSAFAIGAALYYFVVRPRLATLNKGVKKSEKSVYNPKRYREQEVKKKEFTSDEVSKHNTRDDLWIIVKDKVYDVTEYVDLHFGGEEAIARYGGQDNTEVFYGDQHPQPKAEDVLDEFYIGVLKKSNNNNNTNNNNNNNQNSDKKKD